MKNYKDDITIILISYQSRKKVINFIKKINNKIKIIVIENSKDKKIKKDIFKISKKITVIFTPNNGYGSAINLARKNIKTTYFFVFNPDVEGVNINLIKNFYNAAIKLKNKFGVLGPRFIYPNKKSEKKQSNIKKNIDTIHSISGSALFFNKEVFDINNGFDENFFLYFEETDYCVRARKNGYETYQLNTEKVVHKIGTSVEYKDLDEEKKIKDLLLWHFIWSKFYYYKKHYTYFLSLLIFIPTIVRIIFRMIFYKIIKDHIKLNKYSTRFSGLITSIFLKNSFKRI